MEKLLCLLCQELHPSDKAKFLVELRKHINYKTFCCGVCDFKGFSSIEVAEHYNDKHSDADINIRRGNDVYYENLIDRIYKESVIARDHGFQAAVNHCKIKMDKDCKPKPKSPEEPPTDQIPLPSGPDSFSIQALSDQIPMPTMPQMGYNSYGVPSLMSLPIMDKMNVKNLVLNDLFEHYRTYFPITMGISDSSVQSEKKPLINQCHYFSRGYCTSDVNCRFAHGDIITYGVACGLIGLTLKYFNQPYNLDMVHIKKVAAKLRIEHKEEHKIEVPVNQEKNERKILTGLENIKDLDKESKIWSLLRKLGMACMLCKTLVFDTELEARKSHAMSDHVAGDLTSLSANGLFRLVSECFPDAGFQLESEQKAHDALKQAKEVIEQTLEKAQQTEKNLQPRESPSLGRNRRDERSPNRSRHENRSPSRSRRFERSSSRNREENRPRSRSRSHRSRQRSLSSRKSPSRSRRSTPPYYERYRVQTNVNREKFNRSEPKIGFRENRRNGVDRDKDTNKNQKSQVNAEKEACRFFTKNGWCRRDPCPYEHIRSSQEVNKEACRFFAKNGWCTRELCPYTHIKSSQEEDRPSTREQSPEREKEFCRFFAKNNWCGREPCPYSHNMSPIRRNRPSYEGRSQGCHCKF